MQRRFSLLIRTLVCVSGVVLIVLLVFSDSLNGFNSNDVILEDGDVVTAEEATQSWRLKRLELTCTKYSDPQRPEAVALAGAAVDAKQGLEVVYLQGQSTVASVCIPHKVGSHAWGKFARTFNNAGNGNEKSSDRLKDFMKLDSKARAAQSLRVVVVRHPLERLVSVYRMIFEDWCDQDRWLAKQWSNRVCQDQVFKDDVGKDGGNANKKEMEFIQNNKTRFTGSQNFLKEMYNEYKFGNDRYMARIWRKYNPNAKLSADRFKFSFAQFARFIVNGSLDFADDAYVRGHKGLSYHWAPYWQECSSLCSRSPPDLILHLETLQSDLEVLMKALMGESAAGDEAKMAAAAFPHTHRADHKGGGLSSNTELLRRYYSTITKQQVMELYEKYLLDHKLFGYSPVKFIKYAR